MIIYYLSPEAFDDLNEQDDDLFQKDMEKFIRESPRSVKMTLDQFVGMFNREEISDLGYIAWAVGDPSDEEVEFFANTPEGRKAFFAKKLPDNGFTRVLHDAVDEHVISEQDTDEKPKDRDIFDRSDDAYEARRDAAE